MAKEIAFKNGWISNFEGLLTLTLDQVILHTIVHYSSTSAYKPNFIDIEETCSGQMDVCTYERTDGHRRTTLFCNEHCVLHCQLSAHACLIGDKEYDMQITACAMTLSSTGHCAG